MAASFNKFYGFCLKDPFFGLRRFLTIESPLKMMKNALYLILKTLFILEIFTFLF